MTKKGLAILTAIMIALSISACGNSTLIDTVYTYDYCRIKQQDGTIVEGKVQKWADYDGDVVQITVNDTVYYVHMMNVDLIHYK